MWSSWNDRDGAASPVSLWLLVCAGPGDSDGLSCTMGKYGQRCVYMLSACGVSCLTLAFQGKRAMSLPVFWAMLGPRLGLRLAVITCRTFVVSPS